MTPALTADTVNVVLKGSFNPGIFSPSWLFANGVIGEAEHTNSTVELITPDIAKFGCVWLDVTVTRDALQLATVNVDEFERVRDAVIAILNLLPHVPVAVMGINRSAHFGVGGADAWHRVGDRVAPKSIWEGTLVLPGMKSVTLWGIRPDQHAGRVQVTVEPSSLVSFGIFVAHNDHYALADVTAQPSTREEIFAQEMVAVEPSLDKRAAALDLLRTEWQASLARAGKTMERISSLGRAEQA